jgi:hypothetical protein
VNERHAVTYGGETQAKKTHDRPLRGESKIVRGRKSKESLGDKSHRGVLRYRHERVEVKTPDRFGPDQFRGD